MSGTRYVYAVRAGDQLKVGLTGDLTKRLRHLQTGTGHTLEVVGHWEECDAARVEARMHDALAPYRLVGEWFACSDALAHVAHRYAELAALDPNETYVPWHDGLPQSVAFIDWIDDNDCPERELKMLLHVLDGHFPCLRTLAMHGGTIGRLTSAEVDGLWAWWRPKRDAWAHLAALPSCYSGPARTWIYAFYLDAEDDQLEPGETRLAHAINLYERVVAA